ncbi:hypothetical protein ABFS82_04G200200 [Erythranthe guttata]|uniref:Uncharacterized protein n=1 Tax=Erythranthe guttata TaxID=4155 RepID=A0A022RDS7_ERYGU|nr:PREDICTED: uncharacterized protein LOC105958555 [Erythranthe guttata]EYU37035.1 hypothetical protein MIMGU_mgv1a005902mg [Erythranthe guttata]|eukprot:XP_012838013.1 PREDICTED: uncharacterized protein LOC105958555 [Erythranthe guttata]
MADAIEPLDFEFEDTIPISPPLPKKRKKVIGLDDLLEDYKKEQKRLDERKHKQKRSRKVFEAEDDDDDEDDAEARLSECVDQCQKQINQIYGDDEMPLWGIRVFGDQQILPQKEYPELKSSVLLQSFTKNEINSLVELNIEKGENFLEGLLMNGWLLNIVRASSRVEKSIASWTFNLMLYSSKVGLTEAACEFWCAILSFKNKADSSSIKIDWLPRYSDLKRALLAYGFLLDSPSKLSSDIDMVNADSDTAGPPQNIRSWIKFAGVCCRTRDANIILSTKEAEELLVIIISLFLDRQLLGLSMVLNEGMLSVINFFRDEEWPDSSIEVAKSLADRLPCNINCLRVVESIVGIDGRSKQLRSAVAFQFLIKLLGKKVYDTEEVLRLLISINLKDKMCDLSRMYIYLNLAENWLLFDPMLRDKALVRELWCKCLRNCSSGITITDLRSYASIVRSKASYLLQGWASK